jgi:hypothetical protein
MPKGKTKSSCKFDGVDYPSWFFEEENNNNKKETDAIFFFWRETVFLSRRTNGYVLLIHSVTKYNSTTTTISIK